MKKILFAMLLGTLALGALGQGTVCLDSISNTSLDPLATSNGQWWIRNWQAGGRLELLNQDVNVQLLGGVVSGSLTPLVTLLLSDHTADKDITFFGNGQFFDQSGREYFVPGSVANGTAILQIEAWTGLFNTYASAMASGVALTASTREFTQQLGGAGTPSPGLTEMPAIVFGIPEPGVVALAGVGGLLLLVHRRFRAGPG